MIDTPPTFSFTSPDAPSAGGRGGVRVNVAAITPAADDGRAWFVAVLALADRMGRAVGSLYPSDLRRAAETEGLTPPPGKAASAWWGSVVARLLTPSMGWTQRLQPRRNPAASRNGAKEWNVLVYPGSAR